MRAAWVDDLRAGLANAIQQVAAAVGKAGRGISVIAAAAAPYFESLIAIAGGFRALTPMAQDGWAISTYGFMLAPEQHRDAAAAMPCEPQHATELLVAAWSDPDVQRQVCELVPYVYPATNREFALARQRLIARSVDRFAEGLYEEAVLLVYSQLDGIFQDKADELGDDAFARVFSRRPADASSVEFRDIVLGSGSMVGVDEDFYLAVRSGLTESVRVSTLDDRASRHGVLHGRVLGFGSQQRAAKAFAFLAASLELLVAVQGEVPMTDAEAMALSPDGPPGLRVLVQAQLFSPVRAVYMATGGQPPTLALTADPQTAQ
jgi:hypothetical protein